MNNKPTLEDARHSVAMSEQRVEYFQKVLDEITDNHPAFAPSAGLKMCQQLICIIKMTYEELKEVVRLLDEKDEIILEVKKNVDGVYSSRSGI